MTERTAHLIHGFLGAGKTTSRSRFEPLAPDEPHELVVTD
jgi:hypothetical protein